MKSLYIAEKPSVAREFAKALKIEGNKDGYIESENGIVTWCVGHLVTMSYPEAYDPAMKRWSMDTIPFLPEEFKYEVIDGVKKQFKIVNTLLNRGDVDRIYVCTDSGREGEYIYRLVDRMAGSPEKEKRRVWIDSQTEEEILRGVKEAKELSAYDNICSAAYLRAKEDYLMGINFSRALTLKYSYPVKTFLKQDRCVISVGRVMTCVLGMIVKREREIRTFVKTPFYRVIGTMQLDEGTFDGEWKAVEGSKYYNSPLLYKENGFKEEKDAKALIDSLMENPPTNATVEKIEKKTEKKKAPLLYNLAELQNDCSRLFKISPDETLSVVQELYENKLVTYPRTDARVLSTAVTKEITKNIYGLKNFSPVAKYAEEIIERKSYQGLAKTQYVNDSKITDHYAIIPTGQGFANIRKLKPLSMKVYELIARRFLSIFYPPAEYQKLAITCNIKGERFFTNSRVLSEPGYLRVSDKRFYSKENPSANQDVNQGKQVNLENQDEENENAKDDVSENNNEETLLKLLRLKKNDILPVVGMNIKEGETTPPKRYNSGSLILAMENAGQLIEDEELRAQIHGSGIGTSATRAEIIKKLVSNKYLALNKKTQIITPTQLGEMIHDVVYCSMNSLLNPKLTASWEKGLSQVAEGSVTEDEYMEKLNQFVSDKIDLVKQKNYSDVLNRQFNYIAQFYQKGRKEGKSS